MKVAPPIEWNIDVWSEKQSSNSDFTTLFFYRHQLHDIVLWAWRRKDIIGAETVRETQVHSENILNNMLAQLQNDGWQIYGFLEDRNRKRFILNR